MPLDTDFFFKEALGQFVEYEARLTDVAFVEEGQYRVEAEYSRLTPNLTGPIMGTWTVSVELQEQATIEETGDHHTNGISAVVPAEPGDTIDVDYVDVDGEATFNLFAPAPDPPKDPGLVSVVDCGAPEEAVVGDSVTVTATVENANPVEVEADVEIVVGDAAEQVAVEIPADGTATVDVTFAFDEPGEYTPDVSVSL